VKVNRSKKLFVKGRNNETKNHFIPALVFFDSKGKEAFRHVGILEKEQIVSKLKEIGMGT